MVELNLVGNFDEMREQIQEFVNSFKKETKTVMWFSRHDMSEEQLMDLKRIYGEVELIKVNGTIPTAWIMSDLVDLCDVIAIVAPINIQQQFLAVAGEEKDVIVAESKRILVKNQDGEDEAKFVFVNWFKLEKIEVVMTKL